MATHIRIYIAYAWDEDEYKVRAMAKILQTIERFKVFIDIEHLVGNEVATPEAGISSSDVVLLFIGDMYKTDKRSKAEIDYIKLTGKLVIPIRLKKGIPLDGPLSFLPASSCQLDFTNDKPFAKTSEEIILLIKKTLS